MLLAIHNITSPKEWIHNPALRDNEGNTVAIILSTRGIIPPKEWIHRPSL